MIQIIQRIKKLLNDGFWNKLFKNAITVFTGSTGASIINFFVVIITIKILGNFNYAIFILAQQYMLILDALINFQAWQGVIKYGTDAINAHDYEKLAGIIKAGFLIDIFTAFMGIIIAFITLFVVKNIFHWDDIRILLSFIFSIEIIFHIEGTSIGILRLFNKFNFQAIHSIISALITLLVVSLYYISGARNIILFTILYVFLDIIKHLSLVFISFSVLKKMKLFEGQQQINIKKIGKKFYKFTVWTNLSSTLDIPVQYFDVFIISTLSMEMVSVYKVFKQLTKIISSLTRPIAQSILPQFSEIISQGQIDDGYQKIIKIRNVILLLIFVASVITLIIGKPIFCIILGQEFGDNLLLFELLLLINGIGFSYVALHPFFLALGKAKEDAYLNFITNMIYILLAFFLTKVIGIYGIIIAFLVQTLLTLIVKTYITKRTIKFISGGT